MQHFSTAAGKGENGEQKGEVKKGFYYHLLFWEVYLVCVYLVKQDMLHVPFVLV